MIDLPIPETKKVRPRSRPQRWADACAEARRQLDNIEQAASNYNEALEELRSIQEEYSEWKDNLPESLQSSPVGEKLEAICDLDLSDADINTDDAANVIDEAESLDLPRGFGKD